MWELDCEESWVLKNWCFWLWCWRRLLRVPWTARRSNQSILKEISRGCSLEGMMLKLKLQYFGHLMQRVDLLEKTLMLGGILGRRVRGMTEGEMAECHHWLDGHDFWWTSRVGDRQGGLACCNSWGRKESDKTERLNWTEGKETQCLCMIKEYKWISDNIQVSRFRRQRTFQYPFSNVSLWPVFPEQ